MSHVSQSDGWRDQFAGASLSHKRNGRGIVSQPKISHEACEMPDSSGSTAPYDSYVRFASCAYRAAQIESKPDKDLYWTAVRARRAEIKAGGKYGTQTRENAAFWDGVSQLLNRGLSLDDAKRLMSL